MRFIVTVIAVLFAAVPAYAELPDTRAIVETHILPGYEALARESGELAAQAASDCAATSRDLRAAYHDAFDAWVRVSHLRFGPSEQDDRAFALAFWPDSRGSTPKALSSMIRAQDPAVNSPEHFARVSVAARGFYALEFLLYDEQFMQMGDADYRCALIRAVSADIYVNADAILDVWKSGYGELMSTPGNDTYRTAEEAARQLFTALLTGLEFTADTRLGRPMGTFERPRPNRAEARRSGRSLAHVILSLRATQELAALLSSSNSDIDKAFATAIRRAENLDDPVFAGVSTPQGRLRVEVLQQDIGKIRQLLTQQVGPQLGISAGFNSLDGD